MFNQQAQAQNAIPVQLSMPLAGMTDVDRAVIEMVTICLESTGLFRVVDHPEHSRFILKVDYTTLKLEELMAARYCYRTGNTEYVSCYNLLIDISLDLRDSSSGMTFFSERLAYHHNGEYIPELLSVNPGQAITKAMNLMAGSLMSSLYNHCQNNIALFDAIYKSPIQHMPIAFR